MPWARASARCQHGIKTEQENLWRAEWCASWGVRTGTLSFCWCKQKLRWDIYFHIHMKSPDDSRYFNAQNYPEKVFNSSSFISVRHKLIHSNCLALRDATPPKCMHLISGPKMSQWINASHLKCILRSGRAWLLFPQISYSHSPMYK